MDPVVAYIEERAFRNGERLPPERELAETLGISRRAVRRSLEYLELDGQIWRGRRNGTFWGRRPPMAALGIERRLGRASPDDILEARLTLEPAIAALAATKASEADLATIATYMRRTAEATSDDSWAQWDGAFHLAITEATHNDVFVALVTSLNASRAEGPWKRIRVAAMTADKRRNSIAHHRIIVEALRKRSAEEASRAMRRHLLSVQQHMFE